MRQRAELLAIPGFLLAGLTILWFRFNTAPPGAGIEFPFDLVHYYVPMAELAAARLARGELPLWNPHGCGGLPLLATLQSAVLYPPSWLHLLLPAETLLPARIFAELLAGSLLCAAFVRCWGADAASAALAGLLYGGALLLGQSYWPPAVSTLVWLPALLLCVEQLARRLRWRWWLALALATALQLVAGYAQYAVYAFYVVVPFALARLVEESRPGRPGRARAVRGGAAMASAVALGLALAGAQLLPTLELVGESARGTALAPGEQHYLGASPSVAGILHRLADPQPRLPSFGYLRGGAYLGTGSLLLFAVGCVARRRSPSAWALLAVGGAGLLLAPGARGFAAPLFELYSALPTGGLFRTPARLQLLPLFAVAVLAAAGLSALAAAGTTARERRLAGAALLGSAGLVLVFGAAGSAARAAAALSPALVLLWAAPRPQRRRWVRPAQLALLLLVAADLAVFTRDYGSLRAIPMEWARRIHIWGHVGLAPERVAALGGERGLERVALVNVEPVVGSGPVAQLHRIGCNEPLAPRAWAEVLARAGRTDPRVRSLDPTAFGAFYDAASVRRLVTARWRQEPTLPELVRARERLARHLRRSPGPLPGLPDRLAVDVIENEDALPRAYVIHASRVASAEEAREQLLRGAFDPHRLVLLDRAAPSPDGAAGPVRPAHIARYEPERVEIDAEAHSDGWLVLTDTYFPGWRARVGDREVAIRRANGFFRAVPLPAGRHRVVFEYAPASLHRGAALSGAAALSLVLVPALLHRRGAGRRGETAGPPSSPRRAAARHRTPRRGS